MTLPELSIDDSSMEEFPSPPEFILTNKTKKNRDRRHHQRKRKIEETKALREELRLLKETVNVAERLKNSRARGIQNNNQQQQRQQQQQWNQQQHWHCGVAAHKTSRIRNVFMDRSKSWPNSAL